MTAVQLLWFASITGAGLFFIGGVALGLLRARRVPPQAALPDPVAPALRQELEQARHALVASEETARALQLALDDQSARSAQLERERVESGASAGADLKALRDRVAASERARVELHERATRAEAELAEARVQTRRLDTELGTLRAMEQQLRDTEKQLRGQLSQHTSELERVRTGATATQLAWEQSELRLRELERELAERATTVRDLAIHNEQLKGRVDDAEGLRNDYVRLRTTAIETDFLKGEVARLEEELRTLRLDALGTQRRSTAQATTPAAGTSSSTGESLDSIIARFASSGTRSTAVADPRGFPLASRGDDGTALAAFAALLLESANRAQQFLPFAKPSSLELVDDRGARVAVWTFHVDDEQMLLTSLAVDAVEPGRAEEALADLTAVLAPFTATAES